MCVWTLLGSLQWYNRQWKSPAFIGHYKPEILHQLATVPNFLNKVLVERLHNSPVISRLSGRLSSIGRLENVTSALLSNIEGLNQGVLPLNFDAYVKTKKANAAENLNKIADITGTIHYFCYFFTSLL